MKIVGIEGLSDQDIKAELQRGAKFVVFQYCISIIVMTFTRSSNVHFIRAGHSTIGKGLPYVLISLLFGWWGIPWGPIFTVTSVAKSLTGGKDVTADLLASIGT